MGSRKNSIILVFFVLVLFCSIGSVDHCTIWKKIDKRHILQNSFFSLRKDLFGCIPDTNVFNGFTDRCVMHNYIEKNGQFYFEFYAVRNDSVYTCFANGKDKFIKKVNVFLTQRLTSRKEYGKIISSCIRIKKFENDSLCFEVFKFKEVDTRDYPFKVSLPSMLSVIRKDSVIKIDTCSVD